MSQIESLDDGFLDAEPAEVEEPETVTETIEVAAEEPEVVEEPPKTEPEIEPEGETTAPEKDEWTLTAVMDEREKRQAAVKERDEWKVKFEATQTKPDDVSVFEDEKGYTEQQAQSVDQKVAESELRISRAYAVREYGEEKVAASEKWYADEGMKSPHAIDRIHKSGLKFHEAVILMDEEQARLDPDAYEAKIEAKIRAKIEAEQSESSEDTPKSITPSLASLRSAATDNLSTADVDDFLKD